MSLGRIYGVTVSNEAETAAVDIFEVTAPSDGVVVIRSAEITQRSDAGDSEDEMLNVQFIKGHTTSGSGGAAATPRPFQTGTPAFGGTSETANTTVASGGTAITLKSAAFNVRAGFVWYPDPDGMIVLSPSEILVVRLTAPGDSLSYDASLVIEEIGG